jgi:hypothetical protein
MLIDSRLADLFPCIRHRIEAFRFDPPVRESFGEPASIMLIGVQQKGTRISIDNRADSFNLADFRVGRLRRDK